MSLAMAVDGMSFDDARRLKEVALSMMARYFRRNGDHLYFDSKEDRVLALLFAAAICEYKVKRAAADEAAPFDYEQYKNAAVAQKPRSPRNIFA
jgi:hypothetical protein